MALHQQSVRCYLHHYQIRKDKNTDLAVFPKDVTILGSTGAFTEEEVRFEASVHTQLVASTTTGNQSPVSQRPTIYLVGY